MNFCSLEKLRRFCVNPPVPSRRPYRLPTSVRGAGGFFLWFFLVLVAGVIGVVWWKSDSHFQPVRAAIARPATISAAAPAPVVNSSPAWNPTNATNGTNSSTARVPATNSPTAAGTNEFPRAPRDTLELQIALARRVYSSGSIDGVMGAQTRAALLAFQRANQLPPTGELDNPTRSALVLDAPPFQTYVVTSNDLARLQPVSPTWLEKSQQTALDYETILELVAERGHASPTLTRKLNPGVNWTNVIEGTEVKLPAVEYPAPRQKAAFIVINLTEKRLQAFDAETNLLAHFPCSIAARVEKRPAGELRVTAVAPNPDYTFNPELFAESAEARQLKTKLILPPGPNNPVGTAWISLDKPGYGMHGTPIPEQVGRTESHGCFRLANWNAEYLLQLVTIEMPVIVAP
jgi:lipoprotein-anchoring transpeptidase ErfK/SrfK